MCKTKLEHHCKNDATLTNCMRGCNLICKTYKENYDYYQSVVESKGSKTQKEKVVLARLLIIKNDQIL